MDEIIKWSGWIVGIGMVLWEIVKAIRNRPKIKFFIGMSNQENGKTANINLTVINVGRTPVNLIRAGLQYSDGYWSDFSPSIGLFLGWLYHMQPKIYQIEINRIKELMSEVDLPTSVKFIYYAAENGDKYKCKIPSHIREELSSSSTSG